MRSLIEALAIVGVLALLGLVGNSDYEAAAKENERCLQMVADNVWPQGTCEAL